MWYSDKYRNKQKNIIHSANNKCLLKGLKSVALLYVKLLMNVPYTQNCPQYWYHKILAEILVTAAEGSEKGRRDYCDICDTC
jgi:hypothetical protein